MTPVITRTLGAAALLASTGLGYGLWEAQRFTLRRVDVPVLASGEKSMRVLHISDIHLLPNQKAKLEWLRSLQELRPDLVVNTGDNISTASAIEPLLDALGGLLDAPGVFVFGSNDYTAPRFKNPLAYLGLGSHASEQPEQELPWRELRDAMVARGWADLTHQRATLTVAGRLVALRGTDDGHLDRDDYAAVAGPADEGVALNVGVTHAPYLRLLDAMTSDGLDLIMAGHTHGGQVCLPTGALITNCDLDTGRVKGLSTHTATGRTAFLHVSAGIGSSPYAPYRTFCRPEATLLTLVGRD